MQLYNYTIIQLQNTHVSSIICWVGNLFGYKTLSLDYYYNAFKDITMRTMHVCESLFVSSEMVPADKNTAHRGAVDYYNFIGCMCFLVVFFPFRNGTDETLMQQLPQPFLCVSIYVKNNINLINNQPDNS